MPTPPPFYLDNRGRKDIRRRDASGRPLAILPTWVTDDEAREITALLNKGACADRLAGAVEELLFPQEKHRNVREDEIEGVQSKAIEALEEYEGAAHG